jgi:hypothetical protein
MQTMVQVTMLVQVTSDGGVCDTWFFMWHIISYE